MKKFISYGKIVYNKEEIFAVNNTLKKTTQMGVSVATFENKIAKIFGKKYGVMVNSGSSALILALKCLNLKKGSEVITPCLNFGTAVSSIILNDLVPVFVDVNVRTLQINPDLIKKKITNITMSILVPNLIGNIADWKKLKNIASKEKLHIIEDSADTLGAKINNVSTGTYSDISITSFYGSHVIDNKFRIYFLSTITTNYYFLSTIVADHCASAIFLSPTTAVPLYFHTLPCDLIASIFNSSIQSGITGFLNLAFSIVIRNTNLLSYVVLSKPLAVNAAAACPKASTIKTPGITCFPGKCPVKKGSFVVIFL